MEKRVGLILLLVIASFPGIALAQNNNSESGLIDSGEDNKINNAYQCLENQIDSKTSFSLQDSIFSLLALGSDNKIKEKIASEKKTNEACWPKNGCSIKDSAQVLIAYDSVGENIKSIKDWLLSKSQSAKDLIWYLEMDIQNHYPSECTISYDQKESKIRINNDMKLEGNPGSCFEISYGGYWLKVSDKCLEKEFSISCDEDFVTTLVYQKSIGNTVYISSETHSSVSLGTTTEKVVSRCFSTGTKCDYEGTLWAALALSKTGESSDAYLPYLLSSSGENQRFLPSAFNFILTNGDENYNELVQNQKLGKYWDVVGSPYNRFYDSALAMLALSGTGSGELESAKNYLLSVQTKDGCWNNNNIRDTAFILYSAWPRNGKINIAGRELCGTQGYYCEAENACLEIDGINLNEFECGNFREVCCSKKVVEANCNEKRGIVCSYNQKCTGRIESSSDGSCCIDGGCENIQNENLCVLSDGVCKSSCSNDEEDIGESCSNPADACCVVKIEKPESPGGISIIWIIMLIILILLIIVGIIYRHKIQIWWHNRKNNRAGGASSGIGQRPRMPPGAPSGMMFPRPLQRYGPPGQRNVSKPGPGLRETKGVRSQEDREIEETMKKLKEMSK